MLIKVDPFYSAVNEDELYGQTVVVVDAVRSVLVAIRAFESGCCNIIPAWNTESAMNVYHRTEIGSVLLGGEHGSNKIPEFEFGNSPDDYINENLAGKTLALTTRNFSKAVIKNFKADKVYLAGFVNASAAAKKIENASGTVRLVCAGSDGRTAYEDILAAGCIIDRLKRFGAEFETDDMGVVAEKAYNMCRRDLMTAIEHAEQIKILKGLGYENDIRQCLAEDITDLVPIYEEGLITKGETEK